MMATAWPWQQLMDLGLCPEHLLLTALGPALRQLEVLVLNDSLPFGPPWTTLKHKPTLVQHSARDTVMPAAVAARGSAPVIVEQTSADNSPNSPTATGAYSIRQLGSRSDGSVSSASTVSVEETAASGQLLMACTCGACCGGHMGPSPERVTTAAMYHLSR
jgi:hypothetical protein